MAPAAVMQTPAEVAERDGVSKQAVTKTVRKLAEDKSLEVERDERGRIVRFNVAQYDFLRGKVGDPSKDQRPEQPDPPPTPSESRAGYNDAITLKTQYEAETKRLALEEQIGKLVRVDELSAAVNECGAAIAASIGQLLNATDALATAMAQSGTHGLRVELKKIENRIRGEIADSLSALAQLAPAKPAEDQSSAL
jgi:hypothetical protein